MNLIFNDFQYVLLENFDIDFVNSNEKWRNRRQCPKRRYAQSLKMSGEIYLIELIDYY